MIDYLYFASFGNSSPILETGKTFPNFFSCLSTNLSISEPFGSYFFNGGAEEN